MSEKKSVTVNIYGNEYTLKGEADPAYIADLAKFVDAKMNEIGKKSSAPAAKVAILASMNIADELHRLEKSKAENLKLIETLEKNLLDMKKSSEGSLKHTLELKEQLDRFKADSADNQKKVENSESETSSLKKDLEGAKARHDELTMEIEKLKADLEQAREKSGHLGDIQKELHNEKKKAEAAENEAAKLKAELEKVKSAPAPKNAGPSVSNEKVAALIRKIDAILE